MAPSGTSPGSFARAFRRRSPIRAAPNPIRLLSPRPAPCIPSAPSNSNLPPCSCSPETAQRGGIEADPKARGRAERPGDRRAIGHHALGQRTAAAFDLLQRRHCQATVLAPIGRIFTTKLLAVPTGASFERRREGFACLDLRFNEAGVATSLPGTAEIGQPSGDIGSPRSSGETSESRSSSNWGLVWGQWLASSEAGALGRWADQTDAPTRRPSSFKCGRRRRSDRGWL